MVTFEEHPSTYRGARTWMMMCSHILYIHMYLQSAYRMNAPTDEELQQYATIIIGSTTVDQMVLLLLFMVLFMASHTGIGIIVFRRYLAERCTRVCALSNWSLCRCHA